MIAMQQNYDDCRVTKTPLPRRIRKFLSFLALLSIALNLLVPITHSLASNSEATEFLEICTNQGVKLVEVLAPAEAPDSVGTMGSQCSACPDCPLCPAGKAASLLWLDQGTLISLLEISVNVSFKGQRFNIADEPQWFRPALRAPPSI